ncbi:MAG: hypothetical protein ACFUZC_04925 [Chthoniobacteraceae bacterium]
MPKPTTVVIRRSEMVEWLAEYGIPAREVDAIIRDKVIEKRRTRPNGRGFYNVEEIEEKVLAPMLARK